jgi:hypothetical protein
MVSEIDVASVSSNRARRGPEADVSAEILGVGPAASVSVPRLRLVPVVEADEVAVGTDFGVTNDRSPSNRVVGVAAAAVSPVPVRGVSEKPPVDNGKQAEYSQKYARTNINRKYLRKR